MAFHRVYLVFMISLMYPSECISCLLENIDINPSEYDEKNMKKILEEHNKFRSLHGVPDLELDRNISFYAQQWVLYSAHIGMLFSRPHKRYGENLWLGRNASYRKFMKENGLNPVRIWYDQLQNYTRRYDPYREANIVGSRIYVACYYDPPGNIRPKDSKYETTLRYRKNVFPPYGVDWSRTSGSMYLYLITVVVVLAFSVSVWLASQNRDWLRYQFEQHYAEPLGTRW